MWLALVGLVGTFVAGWYLGWTNGLPFLKREILPWCVGIYEGDSPFDLEPGRGVDNPVLSASDVDDVDAEFVADPFLVRTDGRWTMFVEVLDRDTRRGCIATATSEDGRRWTYGGVVLREPFHLSYPHVFRSGDQYFMVPDTPEMYSVRLYRADEFPSRWSFVKTLVGGPLVDPTIVRHRDRWWLFACSTPYEHHTLRLYHADMLTGSWGEHPESPLVEGDPHTARPAGRIVEHEGELYRLAQDDEPDYGRQVWSFRVTELTRSSYREEPAGDDPVLAPGDAPWCARGMHHLDPHPVGSERWLAAVDGKGERWGWGRPRLRVRPPGTAVRGLKAVLGGGDRRQRGAAS